jgi:mannose-1-phosphate guanylyltransferase
MFAVVMAGGSGTRFWPASREKLPKQFLRITSDRTMLEETIRRAMLFAAQEHIYVVINAAHQEVTRQLIGGDARILVEPVGRNTAACIGLAAIHIGRHSESEPIVALPADHFVADPAALADLLSAAAELARSGAIVTLGIVPTRPETGYGYIERTEEEHAVLGKRAFRVKRFIEKPNLERAIEFVSSGKHFWNSGIFIFTAKTILSQIAACMPELHRGLQEIDRAIGSDEYEAVLSRVYSRLDSISIDYGVMEKTRAPIYVLEVGFGWSDVGNWRALYELRQQERDPYENLILGDAITLEARRNLVYSETGRMISLLGVEDLIVVDTRDALLVAKADRSQDVKLFPELLKKNGRAEVC